MKFNCKAVIDFEENSVFTLGGKLKYLLVNVDGPGSGDLNKPMKYNLINLSFGNRYYSPMTEEELVKLLEEDEFIYLGKFSDIFEEKE